MQMSNNVSRITREELPEMILPSSESAQERRGIRLSDSDLSHGKPTSSSSNTSNDGSDNEERNRRDFTIKATRRPAPELPTSFSFPSMTNEPSGQIPFPSFNANPQTPSSNSTIRINHQHHSSTSSSTSSSQHAHIPDPVYPVRNQPIGFLNPRSRSDSTTSLDSHHSDSDGMELKRGPSISGGMRSRERTFSSSSHSSNHSHHGIHSDDEGGRGGGNLSEVELTNKLPLGHRTTRSDSLPVFPPPLSLGEEESRKEKEKRERAFNNLPSDPKKWLPSHLSIYLSHSLSTTSSTSQNPLHPLVAADITAFVTSSHLSGRSFLRLKDSDLDELGINQKWKPLLSLMREKLRRDVLGGKIFGFGGSHREDDSANEGSSNLEKLEEQEEEGEKENWKKSWRKFSASQMKNGGGRVKGMAQAFESPLPATPGSPTFSNSSRNSDRGVGQERDITFSSMFGESRRSHRRNCSNSSNSSAASIDSGSGNDHFEGIGEVGDDQFASGLQYYQLEQSNSTSDAQGDESNLPTKSYQSNITSHSKPYGLVRRLSASTPSKLGGSTSISGSLETTPSKITSRISNRRGIKNDENIQPINLSALENEEEEEESWRRADTLRIPLASPQNSNHSQTFQNLDETTISSPSNGSAKRSALEGLFGLEIPQANTHTSSSSNSNTLSESERRRILSKDLEIMTIQIGGGKDEVGRRSNKGSMVLVRRSQFQDLQRRLAEVEARLEEVISSSSNSRATSPTSNNQQHSRNPSWFSSISSDHPLANQSGPGDKKTDPMGWTQLGGYMIAASIGIGIVAGEVVVGKLFGFRRK